MGIFLASLPRRWDPDHREDSPFGVAAPGNEAGLKLPRVIWNRWVGDYCSTMKFIVLLVSMHAWLYQFYLTWATSLVFNRLWQHLQQSKRCNCFTQGVCFPILPAVWRTDFLSKALTFQIKKQFVLDIWHAFLLLGPCFTQNWPRKREIRPCWSPFKHPGHHIGLPKIGGWQIRSGAVLFRKNRNRHDDGILTENWGGTRCSTMLYGYCCTERWSTGTCVGSKLNLKSKIVENRGRDIFRTWVEKGSHWREEKLHTAARLRPSWRKEPTWRPGLRTGCNWIQSAVGLQKLAVSGPVTNGRPSRTPNPPGPSSAFWSRAASWWRLVRNTTSCCSSPPEPSFRRPRRHGMTVVEMKGFWHSSALLCKCLISGLISSSNLPLCSMSII